MNSGKEPPKQGVPKHLNWFHRLIRNIYLIVYVFFGLNVIASALQAVLTSGSLPGWDEIRQTIVARLITKEPLFSGGAIVILLLVMILGPVYNRRHHRYEEHQGIQRMLARFRQIRSARVEPLNLPRVTKFFGRRGERNALIRALEHQGATATIEGIPGIGKTALAATLVDEVRDGGSFPGGAAWIPCNDLRGDAGLGVLWVNTARLLGIDAVGEAPDAAAQRDALAAVLTELPLMLLVLDNVEPELDLQAAITTLALPGHTTVLITARQHITADVGLIVHLTALPTPDGHALLSERLRHIDPLRPTTTEVGYIDLLVAVLYGVPLALDLTAGYAGIQGLDLGVVLADIQQALLLAPELNDPIRGLVARIDLSIAILPEAEQELFAAISQLAEASFPRAAALALDEATIGARSSRAGVDDLVARALLEPVTGARLCMHPLLREAAALRWATLPEARQHTLGEAQLTYCLNFAEEHSKDPDPQGMEAEAAGLMRALAVAHAQSQHKLVIRLMFAMSHTWFIRGRRLEAEQMYRWVLGAAEACEDREALRTAFLELARVESMTGRIELSRSHYMQSLTLAEALHNQNAIREAIHGIAYQDRELDHLDEARAGFKGALAIAEEMQDLAAQQVELNELAIMDGRAGRIGEARRGFTRSLVIAVQLGDEVGRAYELMNLGASYAFHDPGRNIARGRRYV